MATATKEQKSLSVRAAERCENAEEEICHCRCGGSSHGRGRKSVVTLPLSDSHNVWKHCIHCRGTGLVIDVYKGECNTCTKCEGIGKVKPIRK